MIFNIGQLTASNKRWTRDECRHGHYMYALADYSNPLHCGYIPLTGVEGRGLPLPPPGTSMSPSIDHEPDSRMGKKKERSLAAPLPLFSLIL